MDNKFLNYFSKIVSIRIKGVNVESLLSRIYKKKIEIFDVNKISRREAILKINLRDFERIKQIKTSSEVEIIEYFGLLKAKQTLKFNRMLIYSLILGYLLLILLSNLIFDVQVVHSSSKLRTLVREELNKHGVKRFAFKKSYKKIEEIEQKILNGNKDQLEWIEIDESGTKYIIKVEERKKTEKEEEYIYQDIVAAKNAIIVDVDAESGVLLRKKNDYVKKGDIIISGKIMNGEKLMDIVKASGKILGEVWYNIKVEFPLVHNEAQPTGTKKTVYAIKWLDYRIPIFDIKPFKNKKITEQVLIYNKLIPFKVVKELQEEQAVIDKVYTEGEALKRAQMVAEEKMVDKLLPDEKIISKRALKYYQEDNKIYLEMFFKVHEDISKAQPIELFEQ